VTRIHVSVSPAFLAKLESARLAVSHSMPGASAEDVLTAGLDLLMERDARRKGLVENPRPAPATAPAAPGAVYVPAAVRREVWKRDQGCCQWEVDSGGVCGSRLRLELDHIVPVARGGKSVPGNLRILCARHNLWAAREELGHGLMNKYCRDPRRPQLAGLPGDASGG